MPLSPDRLQPVLAGVVQQLILSMTAFIPIGGAPPLAVTVAEVDGQVTLGVVAILDVRDRFETLQRAVASTRADGVAFVYDGFIRSADGVDVEALLVVAASRYGTEAQAIPYRRDQGQVVMLPPLEAPADVGGAYGRLFPPSSF